MEIEPKQPHTSSLRGRQILEHRKEIDPIRKRAASNGENTPLKRKVFVAMSGGVDSSVAALLLKQEGYDVTGVFMMNWTDTADLPSDSCTWEQDRRDAMRVATRLKIPFFTFDFQKEYRKYVVDYLFSEYKAGGTPNPDIMCNKFIKFDLFLKKSLKLGADFIATGHYARISRHSLVVTPKPAEYILSIPKDTWKDQTYFLYTLAQKQLEHVLFPLAVLLKTEVRAIAKKHGLATASKPESQGICFVGEVPIKRFLQRKLPRKFGSVLNLRGKVIGEHGGAYFCTIGQRHGFHIFNQKTNSQPHYIVEKNVKKNTLVAVEGNTHPKLFQKTLTVDHIHWIAVKPPKMPLPCKARIRHGQPLQSAFARKSDRGWSVVFAKPQYAIAPGQSVVLYTHSGEVLGGGVITPRLGKS